MKIIRYVLIFFGWAAIGLVCWLCFLFMFKPFQEGSYREYYLDNPSLGDENAWIEKELDLPDSIWVTDYYTVKQYSGGKLINEWKAEAVTPQSYGYSVEVNDEWFDISGDIVITKKETFIKR